MLIPHRRRPQVLVFAAFAFAGMAFTKLPLLAVIFGVTLLSITAGKFEPASAQ
jgi:hypothetical protein